MGVTGDRISLCNSPGCLRTHFANQDGPEFINIGLSLSAGIKGMQRRVPSLRCTFNAGRPRLLYKCECVLLCTVCPQHNINDRPLCKPAAACWLGLKSQAEPVLLNAASWSLKHYIVGMSAFTFSLQICIK